MGPDDTTIQEWIRRAKGGDRVAFGHLWQLIEPGLGEEASRQLFGLMRQVVGASEISQETAIRVLQAMPTFQGATLAEFREFARATLRNCSRTAYRREHSQRRGGKRRETGADDLNRDSLASIPDPQISTPSRVASACEQRRRLREAIDRLPSASQRRVLLCRAEGMKLAEISEQEGQSLTAINGLYRRGLAKLRQLLPDIGLDWDAPPPGSSES